MKKPLKIQEYETITTLAAFFLVLNIVLHRQAFVYAALGMLLVGLFVKPVARIISRTWLKFAELLGAFNSKVILTLVFFLFLTPLALLFRLFSNNPLQLKNAGNTKSFYKVRNHQYNREDFEKMW
jgi:hypothetical protein